ncbi:ribosome biogenesis GTPase YlqF [Endozoicomonas sp. OPT23]|uniref:ribosome biogenesis GTPase YlqF n=1 Tax=Endozoicomonas sp. OPT23 TaxID=2072845 RepID=UPI00129B77C4|nr:ribosome biogenesis GTPase YlqF [Endozoicomonas sp. OPT23]MRI35098.1 ribosome biogenesis GTPase YlqF [Endozoicomonas sp. OPT23]
MAAINWFPGHMHKARKEIKKVVPEVDLIIEVLDARIPYSSSNPLVPSLRGKTPFLKVLNKADLADPKVTELWIKELEKEEGVKAIALTQSQPEKVRSVLKLAEGMIGSERNLEIKGMRAMILGIPNVGKSTMINTLANRIIAKTGNVPAVTKQQQRIKLPNGMILLDTPGFLWPKLEPESCGYRLAVTGAIKDAVIEYEDVAFFAAEYFLKVYPEALRSRFLLDELPATDIELMDMIAAKRNCMRRGGISDLHKVSEILLNEFRSGNLGRLSLETPELVEAEKPVKEPESE